MTFPEWFKQHWRAEGESRSRAIYRMCVASGCGHVSVLRALAGEQVSLRVAERLAAPSQGVVDVQGLVFPAAITTEPTRHPGEPSRARPDAITQPMTPVGRGAA